MKTLIAVGDSPLPIAFVSVMPDVHLGKGVTIGSMFASETYVCPNAVAVNIGCSMCAIPAGLCKDDLMLQQKERNAVLDNAQDPDRVQIVLRTSAWCSRGVG